LGKSDAIAEEDADGKACQLQETSRRDFNHCRGAINPGKGVDHMTSVHAAIKGVMGSTEYFSARLSARDLAGLAITAGELDDWKNWSVFERFQRELDLRRVKREMVPYLARTRDRFYSALIILIYQPEVFEFTPADTYMQNLPSSFSEAVSEMGFLTIGGGKLVVLDGQHRLSSLREVLARSNAIDGEFVDDIAADQLSVIFIPHESFEKTRRIFNKVNRYAKPTSASDNVITSEDDGCAIVARWLVEPEPPLGLAGPIPPLSKSDLHGEPLVEWRSSKLEAESTKITTLNHLYQTVQVVLEVNGMPGFDEKHLVNRPDDASLEQAYVICAEWWSKVLAGMKTLGAGYRSPWSIPDRRKYRTEDSMLFRPMGQVVLFRGIAGAVRRGLPLDDAIERANMVTWQTAADHWRDVLVRANGHLMNKESDQKLAGRYVTYCIAADLMSETEIDTLRRDLRKAQDNPRYVLPDPVY